jgi:hypothetical protein
VGFDVISTPLFLFLVIVILCTILHVSCWPLYARNEQYILFIDSIITIYMCVLKILLDKK